MDICIERVFLFRIRSKYNTRGGGGGRHYKFYILPGIRNYRLQEILHLGGEGGGGGPGF